MSTDTRPAGYVAESPWIRRARRAAPSLRLICLPYAGAGASLFRHWPDLLPESVEVLAVQLPGREDRTREALPADVGALATACAAALRPYLTVPFAFYGHCAGALLAYEIAHRTKERYGVSPRQLLAAAYTAPHVPPAGPPAHRLPDDEFVRNLRELGGAPEAVLDNPSFLSFLLPVVRRDFTLFENYRHEPRSPLDCPVTAIRGRDDTVLTDTDCDRWAELTGGPYRRLTVDGGHYFVNDLTPDTVGLIVQALLPTD